MAYNSFEDLPVWQEAARLYELIDDFLENPPPRLRPSFRDQLERAVLSVSNNIAAGFERGNTNELLEFIYIARGSCVDVRSMLSMLARRPWTKPLRENIINIKASATNCSRQLRAWAESLQNSDIKAQRYITDASRNQYEQKQRPEECQKKPVSMLPANHPLRRKEEER
jgi:four helix bundle protein